MRYYIQVMRPDTGGQWKQVKSWTKEVDAIMDAKNTFINHDNVRSQNVMAVRVVKGKRNPVEVFERITS